MSRTFKETKLIEEQQEIFNKFSTFDYENELKNGKEPWNTLDMARIIKSNMSSTNGDTNFSYICDPSNYLAMKMKYCKNEEAIKLYKNLFLYNIIDYSATLYNEKIIDYCSKYGMSYTYTIYKMVKEHNDFNECLFDITPEFFFDKGHKMRGCSLDENNNLVLYDPTKDPDYIDFSKMTDEEYDAYEASLFPDLKENNSNE